MNRFTASETNHSGKRVMLSLALLLAACAMLSACDTPVGIAPDLRGSYWQNALVTHPNGNGPQVVIWGPPDPRVPSGGN
jgi:predicted small secreted protein